MPYNIRQTTRECVYLRSRDKVGGQTIRFTIAENSTFHAYFTTFSSAEPSLLPIKVLHCVTRQFRAFCCCDLDLDLDPMTFAYERDPCPLKIYPKSKNKLGQGCRNLSYYIHTDRQSDHQNYYYAASRVVKNARIEDTQ